MSREVRVCGVDVAPVRADPDETSEQVTQVLRAVPWIDHVEGPVALLEALLDEGEEHPVLLLLAVEEGADVPGAVEDRTRQPY